MKTALTLLAMLALLSCASGPAGISGSAWTKDANGKSVPDSGLEILLYSSNVDPSEQPFLSTMANFEKILGDAETANKKNGASPAELEAGYQTASRMIDAIEETASEFKPTTIKTDAQGKFALTGIQPGRYRILASFRGPDLLLYWSKDVQIRSGHTTHLDLSPDTSTRAIHRISETGK